MKRFASILVPSLSLALSASAAASELDISARIAAPEQRDAQASAETIFSQSLNRTQVDGDNSDRTVYKKFGAGIHGYWGKKATVGIGFSQLNRETDAIKTNGRFIKESTIVTPKLEVNVVDDLNVLISHSAVQTRVDNSFVTSSKYDLNLSRTTLGLVYGDRQNHIGLAFATEAKREKEYLLGGVFPMYDRDYVPRQYDLSGQRQLSSRWSLSGLMRYSHYNEAVYSKQYDTDDAPKSPTLAQVFDYLLTLKVGAAYRLNRYLEASTALVRKAALDVNTYTGDEYIVAYGGLLDVVSHVSKNVTIGAGAERTKGKKTHEVEGKAYDYAANLEVYRGFVGVQL